MVTVKSESEIAVMKKAGAILADVLALVEEHAKPGVTTKYLDKLAYEYIIRQNAVPSFLNYDGFPATLCLSIDDEIVHGIPSDKRVLEEGMLLKVDGGVGIGGMHTDAARSVAIGRISAEKAQLARCCKECFFEGIKVLKDGARLGDYGAVCQKYAESHGYGVVRELVGHGIGATVHEDPSIPNYGMRGRGMRVVSGMTLAIEPMINQGTYKVKQLSDGWTVITADGKLSAHFEHTVAITANGPVILTKI